MRHLTFSILFLIALGSVAQTEYKPGQYMSSTGDVVTGFILDQDWRTNPGFFNFKSTQNSDPQKIFGMKPDHLK
jgi:hypothetical protein